jgi:hypothetical protein
METPGIELGIRQFFDEFVEAFRTFRGTKIAEHYLSPYLAFHAGGRSEVFSSNRDIAEYFQRVLDAYHQKGIRTCSYENLAVVPLGRESALATVTWRMHAEDTTVLVAWRESYNLWRRDGKWMVFTSTDHVT